MDFFIIKDNKQRGPYTLEELAGIGITSETLVWREGLGTWKPAWQVDELRTILDGKPTDAATPPPVPPQENDIVNDETQPDEPSDATAQAGKRRRRRTAKWLAAAAAVFFLLLITCPGEEKHRQTVVDGIAEAAQRENIWQSKDNDLLGAFGETLGNMLVAQFADARQDEDRIVRNTGPCVHLRRRRHRQGHGEGAANARHDGGMKKVKR